MSRRDISNEIIVALSAIAMLALALTFGIVLTISNRGETPVPPTGQAVAAETQTQAFVLAQTASPDVAGTTAAISKTIAAVQTSAAERSAERATVQRGSPSPVPTVTAANDQASPLPSETPTETPSETPAPLTTSTETATEPPTEPPALATAEVQILITATASATATRTARPTTEHTPTRTLTVTASPSRTQRATATNTVTVTPTRTASPTPKPSATFTRTPSSTPTLTPSATRTPSPTRTPSITPTLTPTLFPTITTAISLLAPSPTLSFPTPPPGAVQTIQATPCIPRSGWTPYIIQQGDTLFSIAQQAGISLAELQAASCIMNASRIVAGQVVLVPPGAIVNPRMSAGTLQPTPPPLPGVNARDCGDPAARIVSPAPGAVLTGPFTVIGAASIADFSFYKLEMRPDDGGQNWNNVGTVFSVVDGGVLGRVDTSFFPAGIYWLQLTVVRTDSNYPPPCAIRIIINK